MDDTALIRRLEALEPPQLGSSRQRAMRALPAELRASRTWSRPRERFAAVRVRLAVTLAALCFALAAGALFTPPGRAVTSWVGDQLGFGQPGGPPTLRELRAFAAAGSSGEGQPAYVLLRGPAPVGHYELVTYRMKDDPGKLWPANGARCFELDFPEARQLGGPSCGLPLAEHGLRFEGVGGGSTLEGSEYFHAAGRVSADVESVEIEFRGEPVPVELAPIPEDLIERFQIRRPFKFFIAFLDDAGHGGTLVVTARDAAGRTVAHRRSLLPDVSLLEAQLRGRALPPEPSR